MSIARSVVLIFILENTKSTTGLNIYSILEERPKVFLINVTETSSRRHFWEHFLKLASIPLFSQY